MLAADVTFAPADIIDALTHRGRGQPLAPLRDRCGEATGDTVGQEDGGRTCRYTSNAEIGSV